MDLSSLPIPVGPSPLSLSLILPLPALLRYFFALKQVPFLEASRADHQEGRGNIYIMWLAQVNRRRCVVAGMKKVKPGGPSSTLPELIVGTRSKR